MSKGLKGLAPSLAADNIIMGIVNGVTVPVDPNVVRTRVGHIKSSNADSPNPHSFNNSMIDAIVHFKNRSELPTKTFDVRGFQIARKTRGA